MEHRKHKESKEVILETACRLFAEKGYDKTTVREICKEANTYQVSINYYFGTKENLFKESLIEAYNQTGEKDLNEKIKELSPEQKLKMIIITTLKNLFSDDKNGWFFKILSNGDDIMQKEPVLTIFVETRKKHNTLFKNTLQEIFKNKLDEFTMDYAYFLYASQLITLNHKNICFRSRFMDCNDAEENKISDLAELIYRFIIAGIKDLKE